MSPSTNESRCPARSAAARRLGERAGAEEGELLVAGEGGVGVDQVDLDAVGLGVVEVGDDVGRAARRGGLASPSSLSGRARRRRVSLVLAVAAGQHVAAVAAAVERVVAAAAEQRVGAQQPGQDVLAARAKQRYVVERVAGSDPRSPRCARFSTLSLST